VELGREGLAVKQTPKPNVDYVLSRFIGEQTGAAVGTKAQNAFLVLGVAPNVLRTTNHGKGWPRDAAESVEQRTRELLAIGAVAVTGILKIIWGGVFDCPAQTAAAQDFQTVGKLDGLHGGVVGEGCAGVQRSRTFGAGLPIAVGAKCGGIAKPPPGLGVGERAVA